MSVATAPRIRLPMPHSGLREVLGHRARFKWVAAGRRWRKTTGALHPATETALRGQSVLWLAPTYRQVREAWLEMQKAYAGAADLMESRLEVLFPGGGRILCRSADEWEHLRGYGASGVVVDEAPLIRRAAWYEAIRPIISDTQGWAVLTGTPKGHNWFWEECLKAADDPEAGYWQAPTLGVHIDGDRLIRAPHPLENPDFPFAEAERLWREQPARIFEQEFLAEFVEDAGGVFRRVSQAATAVEQHRPIPGHEYLFGVDWGKWVDFTAVAVLDVGERACVLIDRFNRIDFAVQAERLRVLHDTFKPMAMIVERNAIGEAPLEALVRMGLPVRPWLMTQASKREAVEALSLAFERGEIRIVPDPALVSELQAYTAEKTASGLLAYNAPEGMHDDTVVALMLAWHEGRPTVRLEGPLAQWMSLGPPLESSAGPWGE